MIRYKSNRQLSLEGFHLPFGGKVNPENRWIRWSQSIPWDDLAVGYYKNMSSTQGRPGKDARLVIGSVIIKHKLNLSDKETVLQIQENPYLQHLRRNFRHIENFLDLLGSPAFPLPHKRQRKYWIIQHLYGQQFTMYKGKTRRCDNRIVSISQPHVRPIVRGKASHKVEFGSKLSVSMVDGIALIDHFGWEAFNESTDLRTQIEYYKERYGYYPEVVLADGIYGTRANRKYMKQHNIRFGGKPLGRPKKQTSENAEQLKQEKLQRKQDALERIPIEGKFGQGKNGYRLNYIRAKTLKTSEAWINSIFLVMNLMVLFRICCVQFKKTLGFIQLTLFAKILAKFADWFMPAKSIQFVAG